MIHNSQFIAEQWDSRHHNRAAGVSGVRDTRTSCKTWDNTTQSPNPPYSHIAGAKKLAPHLNFKSVEIGLLDLKHIEEEQKGG